MKLKNIKELSLSSWTRHAQASAMQNLLGPATDPEFISFALGLPAIEFFPKFFYKKIISELIASDPLAFQYSPPLIELKSQIVKLMALRGVTCNEKQIFLTSGAQQGISLLTRILLDQNSEVLIEELAYPGMLQALQPFHPRILTISTDAKTGINVDEVETILKKKHKPAFLYLVTDGSNPHAVNTAESKRIQLAEIANKYGLPIIEDDPYGFLSYQNNLPCLKHYGGDWVFYIGSFSKIFAPSLRTGWLVVPEHITEKLAFLKECSDINISTFTQRTISRLLKYGVFEPHLKKLCFEYKKRRDCLTVALKKYFPQETKFHVPDSGIFTWVELPKKIDTNKLLQLSIENTKTAFIPSAAFYANKKVNITNGMRLNFSLPNEQQIEEGIKRLSFIVHEMLNVSHQKEASQRQYLLTD